MKELKIIVLMPYFGKLPVWERLFFLTCKYNPRIEWRFFSDFKPPRELPKNVTFTRMGLCDFRSLAKRKLGFEIALPYPFKVCDFRPAFGEIFSDFLHGYDYWCWGDTDVFYGDVYGIFKKKRLFEYDIVSVRSEFLSGELCFLKNTACVSKLFQESKDYRRIFTSSQGFDFEELGFFGVHDPCRKIQSFTEVAVAADMKGRIRLFLGDLGHNDRKIPSGRLRLFWEKGELYDVNSGMQSLLYHFLDLKKSPSFTIPEIGGGDEVEKFTVSVNGLKARPDEKKPSLQPWFYTIDKLHRSFRGFRARRRLRNLVATT